LAILPYSKIGRKDVLKESLKQYAKEYFHFEAMYPTFLSAVHSRCSDRKARQLLLDNLWDEEHGEENHVELWLRFCDALGLDREEVDKVFSSLSRFIIFDFFSVKA
jgi:pyrroloquinoline-quinone synthase